MKTLIACLTSLVLSACATDQVLLTGSAPVTAIDKVVSERCIQIADIPPVPAQADLSGDQRQRTAAALAELAELEAYAAKADPLLRKCATREVGHAAK